MKKLQKELEKAKRALLKSSQQNAELILRASKAEAKSSKTLHSPAAAIEETMNMTSQVGALLDAAEGAGLMPNRREKQFSLDEMLKLKQLFDPSFRSSY